MGGYEPSVTVLLSLVFYCKKSFIGEVITHGQHPTYHVSREHLKLLSLNEHLVNPLDPMSVAPSQVWPVSYSPSLVSFQAPHEQQS